MAENKTAEVTEGLLSPQEVLEPSWYEEWLRTQNLLSGESDVDD